MNHTAIGLTMLGLAIGAALYHLFMRIVEYDGLKYAVKIFIKGVFVLAWLGVSLYLIGVR
jgi:hypothetical protein